MRPEDDKAEAASPPAEAADKDQAPVGREMVESPEVNPALGSPNSGKPQMHADQEACQHQQTQQKLAAALDQLAASNTLEDDASNKGTFPRPDDSSCLTRAGPQLTEIPECLPGEEDAAQQESDGFTARVAAALQASTKIIANLTARLEAMVYHRSGVRIQGHAECCAAWAM